MDRQALKRRLLPKIDAALETALDAVQSAPDGQWIAGSEWAVRGAFQELMRECFQEIVQAKVDADPSASPGSFSPGARPAPSPLDELRQKIRPAPQDRLARMVDLNEERTAHILRKWAHPEEAA